MAIPAIPAQGAPWLTYAQALDAEVRGMGVGSGTYAARPAASAVTTGTLYFATDAQEVYRATGTVGQAATSWTPVPTGGTELGYVERTSNFVSAVGSGSADQDVTSLVLTVPVVGERPIEVEAYLLCTSSTANAEITARIYSGATGGTNLAEDHGSSPGSSQFTRLRPVARVVPTAGSSVTYRVTIVPTNGSTATVAGSTAFRAWLRVKTL